MTRLCHNCRTHIPPDTEHYDINGDEYCVDCVDARPYTAYVYYINDDYVGNSEDGDIQFIESYDDLYEED